MLSAGEESHDDKEDTVSEPSERAATGEKNTFYYEWKRERENRKSNVENVFVLERLT